MRVGLVVPPLVAALAWIAIGSAHAGEQIEDNSFLIEEAYNQEPGVVQHIATFDRSDGDWVATLTQEWPLAGRRHQLSYTFALTRVSSQTGLGDFAVHYRYQLTYSERFACSPRLSLLLPTGDSNRERGSGSLGLQLGLPASLVLSDPWVVHLNVGLTMLPRAKDPAGARASTTSVGLGGSVVWRAHRHANLLLESVWARAQSVIGPGQTQWASSWVVSPGLRVAIDLPSGLEIVPGLAVPLGVGPSRGEKGIFLYLSFEHSYRKAR